MRLTHRRAAAGALLTAGVTVLALFAPGSASSATTFSVHEGPTFNSATGADSAKYAINDRIKDAIDHAAYKSEIRVMSWNIMSRAATSALLAAQHRGVTVKVLMDASNWTSEVPNPEFKRLKYGLAAGNRYQSAYGSSYAAVCHGSCRSTNGQAHSKYYMFSQTGSTKWVVMEGSANFTLAAATNQWNDLYTWVRPEFYNFAKGIFSEMAADRKIPGPWRQDQVGANVLTFSPEYGQTYTGDPVQNALNQVRCANATYGNTYHRTIIRYFPDVIRGQRGLTDAKRLKALWNAGCDVRIGYTVLSYDAYKVLTSGSGRGRVPLQHMAVDSNHDGQFDLYFHLKALSINGYIGDNPAAFRLIQGSANASDLSTVSDENQAILYSSYSTKRYQEHMDYWFGHAPSASARPLTVSSPAVRMATLSPDALLTSPAPTTRVIPSDGYIRPGTKVIDPQTGKLVDPYALIQKD